jgi:amino acid transporter
MERANHLVHGITMKWWGIAIIVFLNVIIVLFLVSTFGVSFGLRQELAEYGEIQGESGNMWALGFAFLLLGIPSLFAGICLLVFTKNHWHEKGSRLKTAQLTNAMIPFLGIVILIFASSNLIIAIFSMCLAVLLVALTVVTTYVIFRSRSNTLKNAAIQPF